MMRFLPNFRGASSGALGLQGLDDDPRKKAHSRQSQPDYYAL